MRSTIAYCGLTLALVLAGGSASAAELVTTSESDSDGPITSVLIVDPLDGAVIPQVYPVVIQYETFGGGLEIKLEVDDVEVADCAGQEDFTCTLEVSLTPGPHTLRARSFDNSHLISVTVEEGAATETDSSGSESSGSDSSSDGSGSESSGFSTETEGESETSGDPTTGDTSGSATEGQPATDTDQPGGGSSSSSSSDGAATAGDGDGDKGCACSTGTGAPDLLGLALFALIAPWRRRRA